VGEQVVARLFFIGSSGIIGVRFKDLEEEVLVVSVPIYHSFDDLDLVVDALYEAGVL
jgi:hypothetical protein